MEIFWMFVLTSQLRPKITNSNSFLGYKWKYVIHDPAECDSRMLTKRPSFQDHTKEATKVRYKWFIFSLGNVK